LGADDVYANKNHYAHQKDSPDQPPHVPDESERDRDEIIIFIDADQVQIRSIAVEPHASMRKRPGTRQNGRNLPVPPNDPARGRLDNLIAINVRVDGRRLDLPVPYSHPRGDPLRFLAELPIRL